MRACKATTTTPGRLSRFLRREDGQALVEFAIILPVLILIIMGILYFGRYEDYANQETQLAEEGARYAAVNSNPTTVSGQTLQNYILSQAQPELQTGSSDITVAQVSLYYPTGSSNTVGSSVRACVSTTVKFPFLSSLAPETIAQTATMRIEQAATNWTATATASIPSACAKS